MGHQEYHECYTTHSLSNWHQSCDIVYNTYGFADKCSDVSMNEAACTDGYIHGWKQECLKDGGGVGVLDCNRSPFKPAVTVATFGLITCNNPSVCEAGVWTIGNQSKGNATGSITKSNSRQ